MKKYLFSLALLILSLNGCDYSPVADDLVQRDANEIVAVLSEHGLEASVEKQKGGKGRYSVSVAKSSFTDAVGVLHSLGLPAERKSSFSELVSPAGILPSSREIEALRLDRAAAAEIEDLLRGYPAVASANVIVRLHSLAENTNASAANGTSPSVSVVIQVKNGATLEREEVAKVVAQSVPGVRAESVALSLSPQPVFSAHSKDSSTAKQEGEELVPFLLFWNVPANQYTGIASTLGLLVILMGFLAGLAGYILGQYFLSKQFDASVLSQPSATGLGTKAKLNEIEAPDEDAQDDFESGSDRSKNPDPSGGL